MKPSRRTHLKQLALALAVAGAGLPAAADAHGLLRAHAADRGGVVYAMTNDVAANAILVFARDRHGRLHALPHATTPTGGTGGSSNAPVDPLGSQNSLLFDEASGLLFAVNAGDHTVSAFDTGRRGHRLRLAAQVDSGGFIPVSVAVRDGLLYVLNAGGSGSVATFAIGDEGQLQLLGTLDLGLSNATELPFDNIMAPGQVGIDALGRRLIVAHAGGQEMLVAELDDDGVPQGALVSTPSPGVVPFAFGLTAYGSLLVAEAGSGAVSAYDAPAAGTPMTVSAASVASGQAASCWILVNDDGFAFVANTGSDTVSLYGYTRTGGLTLIDPVAASAGDAPTDMSFAGGGRFIYTLDAASGTISGFAVDADSGALSHVDTEGGLPAGAGIQGIAARDF